MHKKLSKSPITYVLAQVKFTNIELISEYIPKLQDKIRSLFPHFKTVNIQAIQLREGQQPITSTTTQWHFLDKELCTGIILDDQSIVIHTSKYDRFTTLLAKLEHVLTEFNKILNISLLTRFGVRYINFIKSNLELIQPGLLGFHLTSDKLVSSDKFLTKTETRQVSKQGIIKIQSTYAGNKEIISGTKNLFVPTDLINGVNHLSFDHYKEPDKSFLLLDLDHFSIKQADFKIGEAISRLGDLQEVVYAVFCSVVGKEALKNWE